MKTKSFILYEILKKIIESVNQVIRQFSEKDSEITRRMFKYENRKKNPENLKELE